MNIRSYLLSMEEYECVFQKSASTELSAPAWSVPNSVLETRLWQVIISCLREQSLKGCVLVLSGEEGRRYGRGTVAMKWILYKYRDTLMIRETKSVCALSNHLDP